MHALCRSFWRKKTQGFHFSDFFVGIVTTACVLGFVYWRKDYSLFRSMSRKQKGDAIQVHEKASSFLLICIDSWQGHCDTKLQNLAHWASQLPEIGKESVPVLDTLRRQPYLCRHSKTWTQRPSGRS